MERGFAGVASGVILLGIVSFLTDMSTEMILALMPLFMMETLGLSIIAVGIIEGLAEASASVLKMASGWLSDKIGKRRPFVTFGYGLSAVVKPLLYFAATFSHVLAVRVSDRIGKGIRTSPRDALISSLTSEEARGKAFGLHRALDTAGASAGPLIAFLLLPLFTYRQIFFLTAIPGLLAVLLLVSFFTTTKEPIGSEPLRLRMGGEIFNRKFVLFMMATTIIALGNFSYAFFLIRARHLGAVELSIPIFYVLFSGVYALAAFPAGIMADRIGKPESLIFGYIIFSLACLWAAHALTDVYMIAVMILYGIFNAIVMTVQRAIIPDLVKEDLLGMGFGFYHMSVGVGALIASVVAGIMWESIGAWASFYYGASLAILGIAPLIALKKS